ncbi:MAG TPA: amidohydrolase [Acidimicrobiales bacterium]|jgi:5-methylthioadenosine/S-adenosylhomocysteine deaminase|nr:amidohydrolase [Acidimicrobiales bacterium]
MAAPSGGRVRYVADAVVPCDGSGRILVPGAVEVDGDTIVSVGPVDSAGPAGPSNEGTAAAGILTEVRLRGLLLPGLVNVHCHSPMTLFRGTGENLPLDRWLDEVLWPREARLTPDDVYWGMMLGASELLRCGVTTTSEMYFFEDAVADAVLAAGSRAVICPGVLQLPGLEGQSWSKRLSQIVDFHRRRHGQEDRIEVGFGPHAAYTVPLDVLAQTAELARELDALVHIHVAETEGEVDRFAAEHGGTVPEALADAGVLDARVLAAHSIWLTDADLDLYVAHDVAVAHCPQSNAKLASGVARLEDMLKLGIRVGLATDGPASNNDLDLWEDMRLSVMLARIRSGKATSLPAAQVLDLVTRGGAAALGRDDLGSLHAGAKADMVLMDLDDPAFVPLLEDAQLIEHLVWSSQSRLISDVWVGGNQVVADGECLTVEGPKARREVQRRAHRLAGG